METVTHHDRETAYRQRGDGDVSILFVHGSGATHGIWKAQLSRLAGDYTVTALDLSGHGESEDVDSEPGPGTLDAYARDVLAVSGAVDADVLVGNSLGGAVVLTALLDHDADPRGTVLVGSGAKLAVNEALRDLLANDWERAIDVLHEPDRLFHDADDRYVSVSRDAMRAVGQAVTRRDYLSCHTFDVRDRLDEVTCPFFALTGVHDELTPPGYHEFLADHVPDGHWATIADAAHLCMLETPQAFNETLVEWLDGLE